MRWILFVGAALVCIVAAMALLGVLLPRKHSVSRTAQFSRTPEALYALISGPPNWRSDVGSSGYLTATTWWEKDKRGRKVVYELVDEQRPLKRVIRIADKSLPFGGTWTLRIAPTGRGSTVQMTEEGEIYNPLFRFMARFILGYGRTIDTYLRDLRNAEKAGVL